MGSQPGGLIGGDDHSTADITVIATDHGVLSVCQALLRPSLSRWTLIAESELTLKLSALYRRVDWVTGRLRKLPHTTRGGCSVWLNLKPHNLAYNVYHVHHTKIPWHANQMVPNARENTLKKNTYLASATQLLVPLSQDFICETRIIAAARQDIGAH